MFPSRVPVLYLFHIACIVGIIALVVYWTRNPLALLALNWLPDVPLMQDPEQVMRIEAFGRELEDADGGSGRKIGFM
ncbi:MAG: hypothetical protein M3O74_13700 [Pseudomonadota bacterium]|nr:hypothetical protein [Pseudomonadota bacterium]